MLWNMRYLYRKLQGLTAVLCMVILIAGVYRMPVYAASGNVSIAVSASQLNVGDTVNVTITLSSDAAIGAYSMAVSYDPSVLEYSGGDGNGGGGTVSIAGYGDGSTTRLSANLSFRAVANGRSSIATSGSDAYAYDETVLSMSHASTVITVSAPTTATTNTESQNAQSTSSSNNDSTTETVEVMDTSLKSLEISPGTLVPSFSPSVTSYSVELPEDTTSILVSALAKDSTASVTVTHNNDLEPGFNRSYIVVTAVNGAQTTYTLNITCGEATEPEEVPITIDGKVYTPAGDHDLESVTIPEGYLPVKIRYQDQELTAYETSDHTIQILYLLNEEQEGRWFVYEEVSGSFYPYIEVPVMAGRYVILELPSDITLPIGYSPIDLNVNGQSVMAYAKAPQDELVLVYASNMQNAPGFYLYDRTETTFQRYFDQYSGEAAVTETVTETVTEDTTEEPSVPDTTESARFIRVRTLLYIVCVIVVLLLIVLVIMITVMNKRHAPDQDGIAVNEDAKETDHDEQLNTGNPDQNLPAHSSNDFTDED